MHHGKSTYKLWFDYLVLAIRHGVPINESFYADWGTPAELQRTTFERWWRERGRSLRDTDPEKQRHAVALERVGNGYVVVKIATDVNLKVIRRSVGQVVLENRKSRHTRTFSRYAPTSQVNYKTLTAYKRYLEINLSKWADGKSVTEKTAALRARYAKIEERIRKQTATMMAGGKTKAALRFRAHRSNEFDTHDKDAKMKLAGFSTKKAHRWLVSGQLVMLNVAQGEFPGSGYYGPRIAARLRERMENMSIPMKAGSHNGPKKMRGTL